MTDYDRFSAICEAIICYHQDILETGLAEENCCPRRKGRDGPRRSNLPESPRTMAHHFRKYRAPSLCCAIPACLSMVCPGQGYRICTSCSLSRYSGRGLG